MKKSMMFWLLVLFIFTIVMNYLYFFVDIIVVSPRTLLSISKSVGLVILDLIVGAFLLINIVIHLVNGITKFNRWLDNL